MAWRMSDRSGVFRLCGVMVIFRVDFMSGLVLERDVLSYEEFGGYSRFVVNLIASDISDSR